MPDDPFVPSGFKRFFSPQSVSEGDLSIRGIGIRELMPPCMTQRPRGTGDYLIMLFHDPVIAGSRPDAEWTDQPDCMMIWTPGKGQYYGNPERRFNHSWIHCEGPRVAKFLRDSHLPVLRPFPVKDPSRFQQCLLDIHGELVSYARPDFRIIGNLMENSLRQIKRMLEHGNAVTIVPESLLAVRRLLSTAPAQPLTLANMASTAGMSVPHFCASFKKAFGLAPVECLIQHRMHHAAHLLSNWNLTISEIATRTGYDDLFHFSKMFKKHFGVSPRGMRQRQILSDKKAEAD